MNPSLFIEFVEKFFHQIVGSITEKWNGRREEETLLHKTMLTEEYSADMTWGSTDIDHSVVAADVVALDSSLPLKLRDAITSASGKLPKLGVKYRKGEKTISDINIMRARGTDEATIAAKVFDDVTKCVKSIDTRKEIMFQTALSTGQCLVEEGDGSNDGTGIRADFGYKPAHITAAATAWSVTTATPITDIRNVITAAESEGLTLAHAYLQRSYFDHLRRTAEGKELAANFQGLPVTSTSKLPMPGRERMLDALSDEFGIQFHVINSNGFRIQKYDGTTVTVTPWSDGAVVFTTTDRVGRLVYGTLAEETNPVNGVDYEKSGTHVLISKYSKTDPLEEFTAAQAICLPVIDGGSDIFVLQAAGTSEEPRDSEMNGGE